MREKRLPDGRDSVVWHGLGPERAARTRTGLVPVHRVKVRDRGASAGGERSRSPSCRAAQAQPSLDALLPVLYLRGAAMSNLQESLATLLNKKTQTCHSRRSPGCRASGRGANCQPGTTSTSGPMESTSKRR